MTPQDNVRSMTDAQRATCRESLSRACPTCGAIPGRCCVFLSSSPRRSDDCPAIHAGDPLPGEWTHEERWTAKPETSPELMRALSSLLEPDAAAPAAPETPTTPTPAGTCGTCGDVHWMWRQDRMVPCTHCPTPCERCRGDRSAYCGQTPCACSCHTGRSPAPPTPSLAEAARVALDRGHHDTCASALGPYPCSCGYDGLARALAAEEARDKLRRRAAELVRAENACGWITNQEIVAWAELETSR